MQPMFAVTKAIKMPLSFRLGKFRSAQCRLFSASTAPLAMGVAVAFATLVSGCTCQKEPGASKDLNPNNAQPGTQASPGSKAHEPRFPNEASIFYTKQQGERICWYMKETQDSAFQLLSAKAIERATYGATFGQDEWIAQNFPGLDKNFVESLKRVLLTPFKSETNSVTLVNVGPAGFDWMLKAVQSIRMDETAPTCPRKP